MIGAAVNVRYESANDTSILSREFHMLEPRDAMKWESWYPDENTVDFGDAARIAAFAPDA